jgi:uncharacterized protein with PIN domain
MFPITVSDLLKILDSIPVWKDLKALPGRLKSLEERVSALEHKPIASAPKGKRCPFCGEEAFFLEKSERDPIMGDVGVMLRTYKCRSCGQGDTVTEAP